MNDLSKVSFHCCYLWSLLTILGLRETNCTCRQIVDSLNMHSQKRMVLLNAHPSYWLLLIMASPLDLKTACSLLEQGPLGKNWKDCNASQLPKYNAVWPDISNSLHGSSFLKRHNSASPSSIWMRQKMPTSGTCCSHPMRLRLDNVVWSKPVAFSMPPLNFPSKDPCWHVLSSEHTATNSHAHSDSRKPDRNCCPEKGPY